ncbi:MAG: TonB C-terminal domain-containing protein [Deltaproteobacteria bacterium]|nr:TonB C-terminal domain-containing protein [Deltaproteobacteria bacterium]
MDLNDIEIIPVETGRRFKHTKDPVALVLGSGGVIAAIVAMLLLPLVTRASAEKSDQQAGEPFEYVEARILKFGEIKDDTKLPDRIVPPMPTAPEEIIPLDRDENKEEPPKKEEIEEKQPDAVTDDKLRQVFEKARAFAEIQDDYVPEGHPDGVPDGDVTDPLLASMGATYGRKITKYIKERWIVPTLISDKEKAELHVKILIKFDSEMTITEFKILKGTKNRLFDDSVTNAVERTQKEVKHLPEPPDEVAPMIYGGGLVITLHGADAPVQ